MSINAASTLEEIAFTLCTALYEEGVTAVLTGGSAATLYAPNQYQSRDLDFVIQFQSDRANGSEALRNLGFTPESNIYRSEQTPFTVDFIDGPIQIGDEIISTWAELKKENSILFLLTPTDSVRDRLAGFYFWKDYANLEVALSIALNQNIDLDLVKTWSQKENSLEAFEFFLQRLERAKSSA